MFIMLVLEQIFHKENYSEIFFNILLQIMQTYVIYNNVVVFVSEKKEYAV